MSSAVQGGGAPRYGLRRHDAALVARWTGESAWRLAGILDHRTVQEKRRPVSAVQGGGAPRYGLRRHDAALVARWTGESASELAGILNHPTVQEKRRPVSANRYGQTIRRFQGNPAAGRRPARQASRLPQRAGRMPLPLFVEVQKNRTEKRSARPTMVRLIPHQASTAPQRRYPRAGFHACPACFRTLWKE